MSKKICKTCNIEQELLNFRNKRNDCKKCEAKKSKNNYINGGKLKKNIKNENKKKVKLLKNI
jgi:hypothetical protein